MLRRTLVSVAAAVVMLGGWCLARAQEAKPLVTVAFSGYDEVKRDVAMIGQLGGNAKLADALEGMLAMATGGKGLEGLDTTKPWGFVVQTEGEKFPMFGFVPVKDFKKLMELGTQMGLPVKDKGDGAYETTMPGPKVTIKAQGGWAFVTIGDMEPASLPADPSAGVGDLPKKYDIAVRASVQNVPEQFKQLFISQMQMGMAMAGRRTPGESDEEFALRSRMMSQSIQQMVTLVKELDEVTVGFAIDQQTKTAYLDMQMTAVPGSKTAQQMAAMTDAKTNLAGFDLPGAALVSQTASNISDADLAQWKNLTKGGRDKLMKEIANQDLADAELAVAKQIINDLFDVLDKTLDARKVDAGMTVMLAPDAATAALGMQIVDAAKVEKILKQVVAEVGKEDAEIVKLVKFDAETHDGVRFHTVSIPVPADDPDAAKVVKIVGNPLQVVVGVGDAVIYVAGGKNPSSLLKQIIDKSKAEPNKTIPPSRMTLSGAPIAKFIAALADDEPQVKQIATMIAGSLEQSVGKDRLTVTTTAIPNGARVRLELEEGILKLIPTMAPALMGAGGPPPGAAPGGF